MCTATPVSWASWSQAFSAFNLAIARFSVGCGTELQKICKKETAEIFSKPKDLPPLLHDIVSGDILCLHMVTCVYNLQVLCILDLCCNLLFIHPVAWPISIDACKATSVTQLKFFVLMWNHAIIFQVINYADIWESAPMKNHVASKELLRKNQIPIQEGQYQSHLSYKNLKVQEFSEYQLMKDNQSSEAFLVLPLGPILAYGFAGPVHSYSPFFRMQDFSTSTLYKCATSRVAKPTKLLTLKLYLP